MAEDDEEEDIVRPRPFWSGTIAFGLVSLPVSLFPATRGRSFSLKMVDRDGTPLRRRYFCEREQAMLERDEIVRGYKVEEERYVVIEDDELESLEPRKSREIDLRRFVKLEQINPMYFERAYYLVPDEGATKAYRLLARSMEDEQRAGIATFVMRGKEYLVAIVAENGILRAETLRFHDEVRSPQMIGLPERKEADGTTVSEMQKAMQKLSEDEFDREDLGDDYLRRLRAHVDKKLRSGRDVIKAPEEIVEDIEEESNVVDLMEVLKQRLQGKVAPFEREPASAPKAATRSRRAASSELQDLSKRELYERAQELDIPGRSNMSKQELLDVLSRNQ